jgi:hypothetical protein
MKRRLMWVGIGLPLVVSGGLLAVFCVQAYLDGLYFARGLHVFKWMFDILVWVAVLVPALAVAIGVTIKNRLYLRESKMILRAMLIMGGGLPAPLIGMEAISWSFYAGRDAAYRGLDYQAIYDACRELATKAPKDESYLIFEGKESSSGGVELPACIRELRPITVCATQEAVAIQIDGGGPMYHEGIGVLLAGNRADSERCLERFQKALEYSRRLDGSVPVILYRLYDYGIFIDVAREALRSEEPSRQGSRNRGGTGGTRK